MLQKTEIVSEKINCLKNRIITLDELVAVYKDGAFRKLFQVLYMLVEKMMSLGPFSPLLKKGLKSASDNTNKISIINPFLSSHIYESIKDETSFIL